MSAERETHIQKAIEEWAAVAGGPGYARKNEPTLAHYIEVVLAAAERQLRFDATNVLTVYDDHTPPENRGPWRDRLYEWATE
jgi:hypothetical protein